MTWLRFFTDYGLMAKPEMAPILFADALLRGQAINFFNAGNVLRDFIYI